MNTRAFLISHGAKTGAFIKEAQYIKENWFWMKYSYAIAIKVKSRMAELGWTQKQLAESLNCTQQHVSVLLNGKVNMTLETLAKLENALQFDLIGSGLTEFPDLVDEKGRVSYLNSPDTEDDTSTVHTSSLVEGYRPRMKKGPKKK
jgi:transcriptional regulator with XRE-family HTH domain